HLLQKQLNSTMRISRGGFRVRNHLIVEVMTDQGVSGLGEAVGNVKYAQGILENAMIHLAIGFDPFNIEALRQKLLDSQVYFERMGSAICAASAIEMACWDIKGKALGVPVYQLLGGMVHPKLDTYVSDIYWEQEPAAMAKSARRILDRGFTAVKAHVGAENSRKDFNRIRALRSEIGPSTRMMIDLNAGYEYSDALNAALRWSEFDLTWLEEPINPEHRDRMSDLRSRCRVPIAGGENEFRIHGFRDLFEKKSLDIAMPDIGRAGGIQETKDICVLAAAFGVEVSPHCFSSGVLLAATAQLMASTPNAKLLEFDSSDNAIIDDLLITPPQFENGMYLVPENPGLGVVLRPETLKKYKVN
ncbi:MAG: mandelate racemase/muconate lactonizing enzyme family protein, partial [Bdellovibrionota bacterium]